MFDAVVFGMQLSDVIVGSVAIVLCVIGAVALCKRDENELLGMFLGDDDGRC